MTYLTLTIDFEESYRCYSAVAGPVASLVLFVQSVRAAGPNDCPISSQFQDVLLLGSVICTPMGLVFTLRQQNAYTLSLSEA